MQKYISFFFYGGLFTLPPLDLQYWLFYITESWFTHRLQLPELEIVTLWCGVRMAVSDLRWWFVLQLPWPTYVYTVVTQIVNKSLCNVYHIFHTMVYYRRKWQAVWNIPCKSLASDIHLDHSHRHTHTANFWSIGVSNNNSLASEKCEHILSL